MLRFRIVVMFIVMTPTLISSQEIKKSINGTYFMEGAPANLTCSFPRNERYPILMWNARGRGKFSNFNLKCKTLTSCESRRGYRATRRNNDMTLIINQVSRIYTKYECSNLAGTMSQFIKFTIIDNSPLFLYIQKFYRRYYVTSSCSYNQMKIFCQIDNRSLNIQGLNLRKCRNPQMSYLQGYVEPRFSGTITCRVSRGKKNYTAKIRYYRTRYDPYVF